MSCSWLRFILSASSESTFSLSFSSSCWVVSKQYSAVVRILKRQMSYIVFVFWINIIHPQVWGTYQQTRACSSGEYLDTSPSFKRLWNVCKFCIMLTVERSRVILPKDAAVPPTLQIFKIKPRLALAYMREILLLSRITYLGKLFCKILKAYSLKYFWKVRARPSIGWPVLSWVHCTKHFR